MLSTIAHAMTKWVLSLFTMVLLLSCNDDKKTNNTTGITQSSPLTNPAPPQINYGVVATYPHDTNAFTEGFLVHNGTLYESTGSPSDLPQTQSVIGTVDLATGALQVKAELDRDKYFGEGMVIVNNKVYQLTYTTKVGFVYNLNTFKKVGEFTYPSTEGWGMTTDSTHLIMSDGTSKITYLHPETFTPIKEINVTNHLGAVQNLNELEYINGFLYANIYTTNSIVKIDPATGKVVGLLDLTSLDKDAKNKNPGALELNGIAFDKDKDKIYVTGKLWPTIYEINFSH